MEDERTSLSGGASPLTGDRPASPSAAFPSAASNERVTASIENWKRKLLDLSKQNRALNFKMSKVSTIAIVDEQPAEVFRQLYLRERPMRFKAAPEPDEQLSLIEENASLTTHTAQTLVDQSGINQEANRAQNSTIGSSKVSQPNAEEDEDESLNLDFAPYDPSSLDERQTDDWLQTMSRPEALDKSLRRIDERARLQSTSKASTPYSSRSECFTT